MMKKNNMKVKYSKITEKILDLYREELELKLKLALKPPFIWRGKKLK